MKNVRRAIGEASRLLRAGGVTYPKRLLRKHDLKDAFDRENYGYLTEGGVAGGYFQWLTLLAANSDARLIVELGNRYGSSTIGLYHGLQKGQRLVTVDTDKDQRYVPKEVFDDKRITFVFGDCLDLKAYLRTGIEIPFDIDILWTDTVHYDEQLRSEWYVYEPLLADEALVVIDDIRVNDKGKFFAEIPFWKRDLAATCHGNGFGVVHYVRPKHERGKSKEERLQEAMLRSAEVWKRRFDELAYSPAALTRRAATLRKEARRENVKKILGKPVVDSINKVRNALRRR